MDTGFVRASGSKEEQYLSLLAQIKALLEGEDDLIANMANMAACLKYQFGWHWVGFYLVRSGELVLGPFQGPVACTRISIGKGVCGTAWQKNETLVVPDVSHFPGHIACSALSRSEIVVPVRKNAEVIAVLDVDSEHFNDFDVTDSKYLEKAVSLL
jgi:GAF domain-containing protein